jgi:hypothetical protein
VIPRGAYEGWPIMCHNGFLNTRLAGGQWRRAPKRAISSSVRAKAAQMANVPPSGHETEMQLLAG